MDDYSPWGSAEHSPSQPLPDSLPSLDSVLGTAPPVPESSSGGGWQEEEGGWSTPAEYQPQPGGFSSGMEETTEDLDTPQHSSHQQPHAAWPTSNSPPRASFDSYRASTPPAPPGFESPVGSSSAEYQPEPSSHPTPSSPTRLKTTTKPHPPAQSAGDDGWGTHGAEPLPPLGSLSLSSANHTPSRDDDDWRPTEIDDIPPPMPTLGDLFPSAKTRRVDDDEGWGGGNEVTSWSSGHVERDPAESARASAHDDSWPADAIEEAVAVRVSEEKERDSWAPEAEVPEPAQHEEADEEEQHTAEESTAKPASATSSTLPSLFKLPPTLFPGFRKGLKDAAQVSSDAVKGGQQALAAATTTRPSNPNARSSIQGVSEWEANSSLAVPVPVTAPEQAQEEGSEAREGKGGSWWSRAATPPVGRHSADDPRQGGTAASTSGSPVQPDGQAGKLRSFLGRLTRTASGSQDGSEDVEWAPRNLDEVRPPKPREEYVVEEVEDPLDDFFAGSRPRQVARPPARPEPLYDDGYGGLMDKFDRAPAVRKAPLKVTTTTRAPARSLDPFDPFADDDEAQAGAPAIAPIVSPTSSAPSMPRAFSPPIMPSSRPIKFPMAAPPAAAQPKPFAQVASFGRAVPAAHSPLVNSPPVTAPVSDDFDDFFNTATKTAPAPQPIRANVPPVARTSAPPPPLAPSVRPPQPVQPTQQTQPTGKGFGMLLPPPPPLSAGVRSVTPPVLLGGNPVPAVVAGQKPKLPAPAAPKKTGGPLDLDDLSFFES